MIEPAFVGAGFNQRDDRALIVGREIGSATQPRQEPGGARGGEIVSHRRESQELVSRDAKGPREVGEHRAGRLCIIGFLVGDDALRDVHGLAQRLSRRCRALSGSAPAWGQSGRWSGLSLGRSHLGN